MKQLIILAIIVAVYLFIRKLIRDVLSAGHGASSSTGASGGSRAGRRSHRDEGEEMVQDPNCNAFVPVSRSLTVNHEGQTLHFCSEDCAREYARKLKSGEI